MSSITIGGTQTGGTSKTLTPAGQDTSGRYRYALPEHSALHQRLMTVGVKAQPTTKASLGVQEATVDLAFSEAAPSATCCDVQMGGVYLNLKVRYSLNQPDTLVDDVVATLQGVAFATFLKDAIKKGLITL